MRTLPTLALALTLVSGAHADPLTYVPAHDPAEAPHADGTRTLWRGDQFHPVRLPGPAAEANDVFVVDNFRWAFEPGDGVESKWRPVFTRARIDLTKIRQLHLLWAPFKPRFLAGHTAFYIELDDGGLTRADGVTDGPFPNPKGVVLSIEARMKVFVDPETGARTPELYGFKDGVLGKYPVVYSLSTYENYQQRCLDVYESELHSWRFTLDPRETREVARAAMRASVANHRGETYYLTRRSCSTELMDFLIEGLEAAEARADAVAAMQRSLDDTRGVSIWSILGGVRDAGGAVLNFLDPRRFLGFRRDEVQREFLGGVLVNPAMSFPAQMPGVLARRGLLESSDANSIQNFAEGARAPALRPEPQQAPAFWDIMRGP